MRVSNAFKIKTKQLKQQRFVLKLIETETNIITKEVKYGFEGNLFKTIMRQIVFTTKNMNLLKGKNINFQYGLFINNQFEYIDLGDYYIKNIPEANKKTEEAEITAYDKMVHFMKPFKQSELKLTYPCEMSQLVTRMGEVCGVEVYSIDFYNANLMVDEDYFTVQDVTYRDVLEKIAQSTLTTIYIKENKLYLCEVATTPIETLDRSYLSKLIITDKFGEVNALVLGRGAVEDNIEVFNQESINQNGRCEIRFDENEFIQFQREKVIGSMFEKIKGLKYYAFEASDVGVMWLEPATCIALKDNETDIYISYYLSANVTINTGIKSNTEAKVIETTETEYKVTTKEEKRTLKVERMAKKHEGLIQDLIEQNTENSNKLSQHEQTIDSISDTVQNITEPLREYESIKTLQLDECVLGDLLELHIYGNNTVFDYLYCSDDLYCSNDLYCRGDSRIYIKNTEEEKETIYELGVLKVLRQNGEVCDEYVLKDGKAKVIRRINRDGTIKVAEEIEDLGDFKIVLQPGTNIVSIKNYTAKIKVKYAIKNQFTDVFATKVEMSTSIEQTAQGIMNEVSKKVDDEEFGTKMIQDFESVQIAWNKITEFIQFINAQLQIKGDNKKLLMTLDKLGMHFYDSSEQQIGDIGLIEDDLGKHIAFAIDGNKSGNDMVWGINYTSNGETVFTPVFRFGDYNIEEGSETGGVFTVEGILQMNEHSINFLDASICSNLEGLNFNGKIFNFSGEVYADNLSNCVNLTRLQGSISGNYGILNVILKDGQGFALNTSITTSDKRLKENIKNSEIYATDIIKQIKHKKFNWRETGQEQKIGYIAQELEKIDNNFIFKLPKLNNKGEIIDEIYNINILPLLATTTKAFQEQQILIEKQGNEIKQLQKNNKEKDLILKTLIKRLEKLEKGEN